MVRFLIFFFWLLLSLPLSAADLPAPVAKALQAADIPQDTAAVYVRRVDRPQPLIAHDATRAMNPASTMKLLTAYAGLELLGPAYTWKTEVYADGPIKDGVLDGNLIIKGYGDPALTLPAFWDMLRSLRKTGLREIKGNLVLDRSYFEPIAQDAGAFDDEPWRAYNAVPDALMVNFKAVEFSIRPDEAQHRVVVIADPDIPQLKIVNRLELRQGACLDWKGGLGYQVAHEAEQAVITFSGSYAQACGEKSLNLSLVDDADYVYELFRQLWREQGGTLAGVLKQGNVPPDTQLLMQAHSAPLVEAVRMMDKNSNNLMARQMLLTIGAEKGGAPGNVEKGAAAVRAWLASKGLNFAELEIENGAGLSRVERISAQHMGELLVSAWNSPAMPELMSSLPIAAVDGTLEKRLKDTPVAGTAHLKTGSLDGVKALAGYLLDKRGRRWVVVFIVNHAHAAASRSAQDALLEWLYARE